MRTNNRNGFTLIELSIVLVIIGLIVGGILTGQDLINAAAQRAQMSQIEKYRTAVRTFQGKYGYLPGDIPTPYAVNFGFQARGALGGEGDGNGVIEGNCANSANQNFGYEAGCGEQAVFWQDLGASGLIDLAVGTGARYPTITGAPSPNITAATSPAIKNWLPTSKINSAVYAYVFSMNGTNYFGISSVDNIGWTVQAALPPGLTVQQAYNIDSKSDDGYPQSGAVTACYVNFNVDNGVPIVWAAGGTGTTQGAKGGQYCAPTTNATGPATTNCYDNGGASGTQKYSLASNASSPNCALSFKFQ